MRARYPPTARSEGVYYISPNHPTLWGDLSPNTSTPLRLIQLWRL